jgi:DNA-binding CsgD family transcriptional regulator
MEALKALDLRAAFSFIEEAWAHAGEQPFPLETIEALARLIPCDEIGYSELDRIGRRELDHVGTDGSEGENFWEIVDEHPLCRHQLAYGDFSATRLSDVVTRRRLVASRIYAEWFRPAGIEAELEAGIARSRTVTRNFVLDRSSGEFSDRDRAMLELLRPHLARIYDVTAMRRAELGTDDELERLSTREREVLELVAAGLTNAAIGERLWISPGTVKKHLENIYAKLGVAGRTAAAVRGRRVAG